MEANVLFITIIVASGITSRLALDILKGKMSKPDQEESGVVVLEQRMKEIESSAIFKIVQVIYYSHGIALIIVGMMSC
ncbi:MAG: hypothetical protein GC192_21290 [Bacteroidetes bacterium]|nr:hypothetical protein [Bacteroidota bacterium]